MATKRNMNERMDDPDSGFRGDLSAAKRRIRELAEIACERLSAGTLNLASYHLCTYLDVTQGAKYHKCMEAELAEEQILMPPAPDNNPK